MGSSTCTPPDNATHAQPEEPRHQSVEEKNEQQWSVKAGSSESTDGGPLQAQTLEGVADHAPSLEVLAYVSPLSHQRRTKLSELIPDRHKPKVEIPIVQGVTPLVVAPDALHGRAPKQHGGVRQRIVIQQLPSHIAGFRSLGDGIKNRFGVADQQELAAAHRR